MSTVEPLEAPLATEPATPPSSGRRVVSRALFVVAAGVVLALVAGGVVVATRNHSGENNKPVNVKARDAAVDTILKHRAAAVLRHDERAWLADLDPQGSQFQREQRLVFANLRQLNFASWRYEVAREEFSAPQ